MNGRSQAPLLQRPGLSIKKLGFAHPTGLTKAGMTHGGISTGAVCISGHFNDRCKRLWRAFASIRSIHSSA